MESVHITNSDHVDACSSATRVCSARLSLKPSGSSARGAVDGAWWPRSTDPAVELAALIEELGAQRTPVRELALNRARWDSAPRRIRLASGRKVAVDWFHTGDTRMIRIIDTNYQRIDLLVIPVDTTPAVADLALTLATDGRDPDITATRSHHSAPVRLPAEAEASPAHEDGASDHSPSDVIGRRRVVLPDGSSYTARSPNVPDRKDPRHDHEPQDQDPTAVARRTS